MSSSAHRPNSSGAANRSRYKTVLSPSIALLILVGSSRCSLYLEHKRPDYTDVSSIHKGTPRYQVTAVFGKPVESYTKDGKDVDIFQADPNGRYAGTKTAVTTFNTVADIFSIGMWEAVATPAELLTKHKLTTYMVAYAPDQTVASIETVAAPVPSSGPAIPSDSAAPAATLSPGAAASPIADATPVAGAAPAAGTTTAPPASPTE